MEALGYPRLEDHREKHMQFVDDLSNKILGLTLDSISPEKIEAFLVDWFLQHTANEDKKIAEFQKRAAAEKSNA
jgi:hemerythrin